jgi:hypothetical protein
MRTPFRGNYEDVLRTLNTAWGKKKCLCEINNDGFPRTIENMLRGHQNFWGLRVGADSNTGQVNGIYNYTVDAPGYTSSGSIAHNSSVSETAFDSAYSALGLIPKGSSVTIYRSPWNNGLDLNHWIDHSATDAGELKIRIYNGSGGSVSLAAGNWYITVITFAD